jgi:hypothetical protein
VYLIHIIRVSITLCQEKSTGFSPAAKLMSRKDLHNLSGWILVINLTDLERDKDSLPTEEVRGLKKHKVDL